MTMVRSSIVPPRLPACDGYGGWVSSAGRVTQSEVARRARCLQMIVSVGFAPWASGLSAVDVVHVHRVGRGDAHSCDAQLTAMPITAQHPRTDVAPCAGASLRPSAAHDLSVRV